MFVGWYQRLFKTLFANGRNKWIEHIISSFLTISILRGLNVVIGIGLIVIGVYELIDRGWEIIVRFGIEDYILL